ncbi:MAG: hypothetical protein ACO1RX_09860 [Candidatus Sericytochromatia bacterium]
MKQLLPSLILLSLALPVQADYIQQMPQGQLNWSTQTLEVTGSGLPKRTGNAAQEKLLARRAATADAYRKLLELVEGVQVEAETTVRDYLTESDVVRTRVQGVIKGAQPVGESLSADGATEVTLRLPLFGPLASALGYGSVVQRQQIRSQSHLPLDWMLASSDLTAPFQLARCQRFAPASPEPTPESAPELPSEAAAEPEPSEEVTPEAEPEWETPAETEDTNSSSRLRAENPEQPFTGLIVDARGLGLSASMSPVVLSPEQQIYVGPFELDIDRVINEGIVLYFDSMENAEASQRAGAHPLVVRAVDTDRHRVNFVLDADDARQIAEFDARDGFLKQLQVVAVL